MKTRTIIAVLLVSIATALILLLPERGGVTERPSIGQSEAQAAKVAEKEPEEQVPSEDSIDQAGSDFVDPERERLEAIRAEWITESYAKNVELTQRKNRSTVGKKFEWLDRSFLPDDAFQHIVRQLPADWGQTDSIYDDEGKKIEPLAEPLTGKAAGSLLGRSVSWAYPIVKGMEVDGYFLFSGGTEEWAIYDFSSGFAVDAKTGRIHLWRSEEQLQRFEELRILEEQARLRRAEERSRKEDEERVRRRNAQ